MATVIGFVGAVILRLYGLGRSLWTAEAWVANSAIAGSLAQVFYYDAWLQTSPPLFLLLVRASVDIFGLSDWSLRLVPVAFSACSIVFLALFSFRVFRPPLAWLCTSLAAFSPFAIAYSKELKQYTADAAATTLLLLLLWNYKSTPDRRNFVTLVLAFALLPLCSYTAIMLLPLALVVLVLTVPHPAAPARWKYVRRRCQALLAVTLVESAAVYLLFVRPNLAPNLAEFWQWGFPHATGLRAITGFYLNSFLAMAAYFFVPDHLRLGLYNLLALSRGVLAAVAAAGLAALGLTFMGCRRDARRSWLATFALLPVLTLAAFNAVHLYPAGARKLTLFLLPCVSLGIALLVECVCDLGAARLGSRWFPHAFTWLLSFFVAAAAALAGWSEARRPIQQEDVEAALRYLRRAEAADERLYVHASLAEPAKLYFRMLAWKPQPLVFGDSGYPCCTRKPENPWGGAERSQREIAALERSGRPAGLWLLFTGRQQHWLEIGHDDPKLAVRLLRDDGCQELFVPAFSNVILLHFACGGDANPFSPPIAPSIRPPL